MRLLLADDSRGYRLLVRTALRDTAALELVAEVDHVDAVAEVTAATRPDAALIDLFLPGGGGFAAAQAIHGVRPQCATIVSSAHAVDELRATGEVGGVAFLGKGVPARRLADEITALVGVLRRTEDAEDEAEVTLPPDRSSAAAARSFCTRALQRWGCDELADTVKLLVSETVGNAVLHARTQVDVAIRLYPDRVRVEVGDHSPLHVRRRDATDEDTSGRGSELIDLLSRAWGMVGRPDGKCLWFELDRPAEHAAPG